jgi:hypothetical protein
MIIDPGPFAPWVAMIVPEQIIPVLPLEADMLVSVKPVAAISLSLQEKLYIDFCRRF